VESLREGEESAPLQLAGGKGQSEVRAKHFRKPRDPQGRSLTDALGFWMVTTDTRASVSGWCVEREKERNLCGLRL
jgi:hypothetical protein